MQSAINTDPISSTPIFDSTEHYSFVFFGTQEPVDKDGLFLYHLNHSTGELTRVSSTDGGEKPGYLTLDSENRFVYSVNKNGDGAVRAYMVDHRTGNFKFINEQTCSGGPCHVTVDKTNKILFVANYAGGSLALFPILEDGGLGPVSYRKQHHGSSVNKDRQEGPHVHFITPDPTNQYALVVDLGLDQIVGYHLNLEKATLTLREAGPSLNTKPGSGPRHLDFHPNGAWAYLIYELNSTVSALKYDSSTGSFTVTQTLPTIPEDFKEQNKTAAIHVSPNGKFLYGSNRGHDSIAVYSINQETGELTFVEYVSTEGKGPRDFDIDPTGTFLVAANQNSDNVLVFKIDSKTGKLTRDRIYQVPSPICVKIIRGV